MEMEIKFELENNDTEYIFTPDFRLSANYTDETKISWRLSDKLSEIDVGILFSGFPAKVPIPPSRRDREDL